MIQVGKKYCPVCASNGGFGRELDVYGPAGAGKYIQPCRYPWQTPIGILNEDVTTGSSVVVRFTGMFELRWNNNTDAGTDADIYGCGGSNRAVIGERVYYDANHSIYVAEHATNCTPTSTTYTNWIGNYPGSATIGYISASRDDPDVTNAGWVTITIDPRPARATYRVCTFQIPDGSTQTPPTVGMPITIPVSTKDAVQYNPDVYGETCDGVIAGVAGTFTDALYFVVVCTAGPAWIFPTKDTLYHDASHSDLVEIGYPSENVPITTDMSVLPGKKASDPADPVIGLVHLKKWYNQAPLGNEEDPDPYYVIADIKPEAPTLPAPEENNTNNQKGE